MLIVGTGKRDKEPFATAIEFDGPIGNPMEAIYLLVNRKGLFREFIETISLIHEGSVIRHWRLNETE